MKKLNKNNYEHKVKIIVDNIIRLNNIYSNGGVGIKTSITENTTCKNCNKNGIN